MQMCVISTAGDLGAACRYLCWETKWVRFPVFIPARREKSRPY